MGVDMMAIQDKAAQRLLTASPEDNDGRVVARLAEIVGQPLAVTRKTLFQDDGNTHEVIEAVKRPRGITAEQIGQMTHVLGLAMSPLPEDQIIAGLGRLDAITARRKDDVGSLRLRLRTYAKALRRYPADAVATTLNDRWQWFPTLAELERRCEDLCRNRWRLLRMVRSWRPWSRDDEVAWLREQADKARFEARYYRGADDARATAAAAREREMLLRLHKMGAGMHPDEAARRAEATLASFWATVGANDGSEASPVAQDARNEGVGYVGTPKRLSRILEPLAGRETDPAAIARPRVEREDE